MLWRHWKLSTVVERKPMGDTIIQDTRKIQEERFDLVCVDPKSEPKTLKGRHLLRQMNESE